jgi:hypothetical protein
MAGFGVTALLDTSTLNKDLRHLLSFDDYLCSLVEVIKKWSGALRIYFCAQFSPVQIPIMLNLLYVLVPMRPG